MSEQFDIKKAFARLIETTEDPLAPIRMQKAYGAIADLGQMMAGQCDAVKVSKYVDYMTQEWSNEINKVCHEPEFIMALCGMLSESLVTYARKVAGDPTIT